VASAFRQLSEAQGGHGLLRASAAYSTGAHDEWNIVVRINRKRGIGDQVAMFFDGRPASPAEMETEITPGYEAR